MTAEVTRASLLSMQVCVPEDWSDNQIVQFAEEKNPCGTQNGWFIRKQGSQRLSGNDERVACAEREGYVHIILEA